MYNRGRDLKVIFVKAFFYLNKKLSSPNKKKKKKKLLSTNVCMFPLYLLLA